MHLTYILNDIYQLNNIHLKLTQSSVVMLITIDMNPARCHKLELISEWLELNTNYKDWPIIKHQNYGRKYPSKITHLDILCPWLQ